MAINLTHRPDLDLRVEKLAFRLGINGRGRKTAVIEKALSALEAQAPLMSSEDILKALDKYGGSADLIAAELANDRDLDHSKPLSQALQDVLYDEHGLPK